MSQIIAGIYEIKEKIGAGGGGTVYLGEHLRLEKQVVLKADKRTLNAGKEVLRREVDLLKELSHTYIPQVYDFVEQDGVVYTVMDYIDGESLDKVLGRGLKPSQKQIIKWSCQLLEALKYLHGYPPYGILHGDIKPANVMLRPNGDICLIDFNIALALGEEGAVKVGFSRGYASPEHYGEDYVRENKSAAIGHGSDIKTHKKYGISTQTEADDDKTAVDTDKTVRGTVKTPSVVRSTTSGQKAIMLDVRSDIYSLGATIYHLLSGHRPAQDALEVQPLGTEVCSPAVSKIIQKAMAPNPNMRYQSADEMLEAFRLLHKSDERAVKHRRKKITSAAILSAMFFIGGICTFIGLKQLEQRQTALTLAEYSANALQEGDVSTALSHALEAIPTGKSILEAPITAQAQLALTNALGVYDLSDGFKALDTIELPGAPFDVKVSPGEKYFAVVYAYEVAVFDMSTQKKVVLFPVQNSALSDVVFVDDSRIIYAGIDGITAYDLNEQKQLWTGKTATTLTMSEDKKTVAAVNRDETFATVYRVSDGAELATCDFAGLHMSVATNDIFIDPQVDVFALNSDGSMLAVSFFNGGLTIFNLKNSDDDLIIYEESECRDFDGGFSGNYFAYIAKKSEGYVFEVIDTAEAVFVSAMDSQEKLQLCTDSNGIYLASGNVLVNFEPSTGKQLEMAYTNEANIVGFSVGEKYTLVATDNNKFSFYDSGANLSSSESCNELCDYTVMTENYAIVANHNEPGIRILEMENHEETQLLSYDARYKHDEARISYDGRTVMMFSNQGFRIYDMSGNLLKETKIPEAGNIYDQQFRKSEEGSWLEVIWYDGMRRCYSAKDGALILEETGEEPNKNLYEEFYVSGYRIESSLHSAPQVYEVESHKLVATLEEDSYLTYVTEVGEYIITEYISASGERYGILLDENFEKLAYFPKLCDVIGDMLVFDYESGNLRQCRLYSLRELTALGETNIQ